MIELPPTCLVSCDVTSCNNTETVELSECLGVNTWHIDNVDDYLIAQGWKYLRESGRWLCDMHAKMPEEELD